MIFETVASFVLLSSNVIDTFSLLLFTGINTDSLHAFYQFLYVISITVVFLKESSYIHVDVFLGTNNTV